jgi:hypothetical protein
MLWAGQGGCRLAQPALTEAQARSAGGQRADGIIPFWLRSAAEVREQAAEYRRMAETARVLSARGALVKFADRLGALWRTSASRSSYVADLPTG